MSPISAALAPWHEFYALVGTASATLIGLLFVAASVSSGVFTAGRQAALRVFLSATVVNFSLILLTSLIIVTPLRNEIVIGLMVAGCGAFGLAHSGLALRDSLRDGLIAAIDLEDRTWYIAFPVVGYLLSVAAGGALAFRPNIGCDVLGLAIGALLITGIHNAWDITLWAVTRRSQ